MTAASFDLFISYSSSNLADADNLRGLLESYGLSCFLARRDIPGGDDFAETIRRALRRSNEICVLLTPESLKSEWITSEWGAAWVLGKRITPILLRCGPAELPDRLRRLQCVDFHKVSEFVADYRRRASSQGSQPETSIPEPAAARRSRATRSDRARRPQPPGDAASAELDLGPIRDLIDDPAVTEVMVNSPEEVYYERDGRIFRFDGRFRDADHVMQLIEGILAPLGRWVDESFPLATVRLSDGTMVNVVIPPLVQTSNITIRKLQMQSYELNDLVAAGMLTNNMADFLRACVRVRLNVLVSGYFGVGRQILICALSSCISPNERVIAVEDPRELKLSHPHVVSLEARPPGLEGRGEVTVRDLVRHALRMRPDRVIVGEIRGAEAMDILQAAHGGMDGFLAAIYSHSPQDSLFRLENMILMAGLEMPLAAIREQISSGIDLIIHVNRFPDGMRRITLISEVAGMEQERVKLRDICLFQSKGVDAHGRVIGNHSFSGIRPAFADRFEAAGIEFDANLFRSGRS